MTFVALVLKPFFALAFLGLVVLPISCVLRRLIPDGPVKAALYRRRVAWWDKPLLNRHRRPDR